MADNVLRFNFLVGRNEVPGAAEKSSSALSRLSARTVAFGTAAGQIMAGVVTRFGSMAASGVVMGVKTAAAMEQAQIGFTALLGSSTKAGDYLKWLKNFAAATPFEFPGLVDASRTLIGVGQSTAQAKATLQSFGDTASAVGIQQDAFQRIMLAVSQSISAGKIKLGDMNQLMNNGLPIWKLLSEAIGKPVPEIQKMITKGQLLTADVLPKLQKQMEKDYGGAMAKQSQTLAGLWSTLMDTLNLGLAGVIVPMMPALRTLATAGIGFLGKALGGLSSLMQKATDSGSSFLPTLKAVGAWVMSTGRSLWKDLGPLFRDLAAWFTKDFLPALVKASREVFPKVGSAIGAIVKTISSHTTDIESFFTNLGQTLTQTVLPALGTLADVAKVTIVPVLGGLLSIMGKLNGPTMGAALALGAFALSFGRIKNAVGGVTGALGDIKGKGIGGFLSMLGGPWGIGIGLASTVLGAWLGKLQESKQRVDDLTAAIKADNGALGANTRESVINALEQDGVLKSAVRLGLSLSDVTDAALGNADAQARVNAVLDQQLRTYDAARKGTQRAVPVVGDFQRAALNVRDAVSGMNGQVNDAAAAAKRQAAAMTPATRNTNVLRGATDAAGGAMKAARDAARAYAGSILKIPGSHSTRFGTPGLAAARAGVRGLTSDIAHINGRTVTVTMRADGTVLMTARSGSSVSSRIARASGGAIPGFSPSATADNIPALLTAGEHVWSVAETRAAGGHGVVERLRALARAGLFRAYASGGGVTARFTSSLPPYGTVQHFFDQLAAGWANGQGGVGGSSGSFINGGNAGNKALGQKMAASFYGWRGAQWTALNNLWMGESGWNNRALNASSGAFGIPQALPASKMGALAVSGNAWAQILWGLRYIHDVYGSPASAYGRWLSRSPHWYDQGGVARGRGLIAKGPLPERILSPRQTAAFERLVPALTRTGGAAQVVINLHAPNYIGSRDELVRTFDQLSRQGRLDRAIRRAMP